MKHKKTIIYILVAMALVVVATVAYFAIVQPSIIAGKMKPGIVDARSSKEPEYENTRAARIEVLRSAGVIKTGEPTYSSKVNACYINYNTAGFVTESWFQDCYLRYVDLFPVNIAPAEIIDKVAAAPASKNVFGDSVVVYGGRCNTLFWKDLQDTLYHIVADNGTLSNSQSCVMPKASQGYGAVKGPMILDDNLAIETYRTFDTAKIDTSKDYILLELNGTYYHQDIGCVGVLFCASPLNKPVTVF